MSQALASRPLVSQAIPESGVARILAQGLLVVAGTLLLTLSAKTRLVLGPVDMSLQTLAVLLIAASFGLRLGLATVLLYLAEGAAGLPVFQATPEKGIGLAYMLGTTGGYLAGFVAMTVIVGYAADRGWDRNVFKLFGAMLTAEVVMMALGFAWLAMLIGAEGAWTFGVVPFVVPDLVKVALAACLVPAGWSVIRGLGLARS
ncbi:biotin transporter BioY [Chelativorans sp. SCAU2101]|uniref:Biotin transporter n=1 Tax=Chelativorans petroleitrophicus TaxID=2975484 RepID=A0A9X2X9J9_9HYPH|nr:biotin transporter BioY [Chelativorans petroleitrophicus]MCT8991465.1 biotin transporter BioY [Chelativorans petroleitrophicus]